MLIDLRGTGTRFASPAEGGEVLLIPELPLYHPFFTVDLGVSRFSGETASVTIQGSSNKAKSTGENFGLFRSGATCQKYGQLSKR